ncbi:mitochondrial carrier [Cucurbitaria berberidis CBS 394.84]|uniref:Mitochondrial carrier n=1 Tax=Cucurbitaria berberidis CBS 394.84 TaxID=1168544 RepID=A0A9P4LC89_9PLEO|nr:mitochondrial carrier [Cucurbitaria berberidis CBS 394.84]KAF1849127.1 mitochondrial carrier [Cucurbitaria berberidis CBS 394.84]
MAPEDSSDRTSYVYNSQLDAFTLYHISNGTGRSHSVVGPGLPALGHALSGAAGTAISKLITYPLDLVITRLQVQRQLQHDEKPLHYNGILDAIEKIYEREGGLQAFYSGVVHETVKGVADSFLFFLVYSYVRQKRLNSRDNGKNLPSLEEIGVGMVAGAFSKFFTTPIQQIVTRKQTSAMLKGASGTSIPPLSSTADIAREIKREKGLQGFWSGYSASLVLTLNPSITMLLHKVLLRLLVSRANRENPGARITFLLAAISKALASTVTYPFSLAKTRAQVSAQKPSATAGETSEQEKTEKPLGARMARARQGTIFSTIVRIAQTEGLWGLYQGLGAEVLKGFFSHGITMLMKDRIHTAIISLYYSVLESLQKYPSPGEVAKTATDGVKDAYESSKEQVSEAYAKGVELAGNASGRVKDAVAEGSQQAQDLVERGKEQASDLYSRGAQATETASSSAQDAVQRSSQQAGSLLEKGKDQAKEAYTKSGEVAEWASSTTRDAAVDSSQRAGELLERGKDAAGNAIGQAKDGLLQADVRDIDGPDTGIKE